MEVKANHVVHWLNLGMYDAVDANPIFFHGVATEAEKYALVSAIEPRQFVHNCPYFDDPRKPDRILTK